MCPQGPLEILDKEMGRTFVFGFLLSRFPTFVVPGQENFTESNILLKSKEPNVPYFSKNSVQLGHITM